MLNDCTIRIDNSHSVCKQEQFSICMYSSGYCLCALLWSKPASSVVSSFRFAWRMPPHCVCVEWKKNIQLIYHFIRMCARAKSHAKCSVFIESQCKVHVPMNVDDLFHIRINLYCSHSSCFDYILFRFVSFLLQTNKKKKYDSCFGFHRSHQINISDAHRSSGCFSTLCELNLADFLVYAIPFFVPGLK